MKLIASLKWIVITFILMAFISCDKNYTVFYEDDDAKDLSVFSDKGNNLMSCYINGQPFRTRDRIFNGGFSRGVFSPEIELYKVDSAADSDTLFIDWLRDQFTNPEYVSLVLVVKKGFSPNDLNSFNNTRLVVNGVNGYFMINHNPLEKGTGTIYFHKVIFAYSNSLETNNLLSGVFEATLPSYKITRGRFDHSLPVGGEDGVVFF